MNMFKHKFLKIGVAFALSCISIPTFAADRPSIVVAVQGIPDTLSPCGPTRNTAYRTLYNIYDFMIGADFTNNFATRPSLATEWKRVDDFTMELKLRDGVLFHDGTEMTVEDVVFSLGEERMMDKTSPCYPISRQFLGTIDKVEAIDDHTVRIITKTTDPVLEMRLSGWMTQIVSKKAFQAAKSFEAFSQKPIGTGPYKVVDFSPGQYIDLEAHDGYWAGKPPYATLRFQVVPEVAGRIAGLVSGDFDMITEIAPDLFASIESYDDLEIIGGAVGNHRMLSYPKYATALADVKVRQAMSLSVDRQAIVDAFWGGRISVTNGFQFPFYGDMYIEDYPEFEYSPEKAKALLADSSYDGSIIPIYMIDGYYTADVATIEALVDMWKKVGINVEIHLKDGWGDVHVSPPENFYNTSCTMVMPDPTAEIWRCWNPSGNARQKGYWNNEEFDKMGAILETSLDLDERRAAFKRMMDIFLTEDPGGTVLHSMGMFYGKRKDLAFTAYPTPYMDFGPLNPAQQK